MKLLLILTLATRNPVIIISLSSIRQYLYLTLFIINNLYYPVDSLVAMLRVEWLDSLLIATLMSLHTSQLAYRFVIYYSHIGPKHSIVYL